MSCCLSARVLPTAEALSPIIAAWKEKDRRPPCVRPGYALVASVCLLVGLPMSAASASDSPASGELTGIVLYAPEDLYTAADAAAVEPTAAADPTRAVAHLEAALAQRVEAGRVSAAFRAAAELCTIEPDHAVARRVLGYHRTAAGWGGGYAQLRQRRGETWHPQFGWIRPADRASWEQGLRPWGKRWIDLDEDRRRHDRLEQGWTLRTDHFFITTNHSRPAAVDLAVRLEQLYQLWRQLFGEMAVSARELEARLAGKEPAGYRRKPFRVWYHRTRDEYNEALRDRQPQIARTLGIYFDRERETHFFAGDEQHPGTIHHEAVHQFFYESSDAKRQLALVANAWVTEGVACYFESLAPAGRRRIVIGAPGKGRLPAARHRLLVDNYYVPLAELSALGIDALQNRPDLPRIYSQSAGLATFFMQSAGAERRDVFRELLAAVYAGRDDQGTLQRASGQRLVELDRAYRQFLETLPTHAAP